MATYIQGVTDYIPQIQPFKPDLNFYQGVLETKQAQYQAGYDKISNMYGTLLNSELSRGDNIERRDEFFNKIQSNIQKISSLDLSRSENVNAASKVFQPLIDDKYILKDMSFTKTYRDEQGKAQYFLNCTDEKKCGGKYWDGGVRALDYQRADFIDASIDESLGFQNPTYTPYVDVYKKAMDFAKEMDFNISLPSTSADGKYRMQTKNGPAMITDLTDSFVKLVANDPAAIAMYNTQAYLQRKDYVYSNADKFSGDKVAAEKEYLFSQAKVINQNMLELKKMSEEKLKQVKVQQKVGEQVQNTVPLNEEIDAEFLNMLNGLPAEAANAESVNSVATQALNNTDGIDYQNMSLMALRQRIDAATANELLFGDMQGAAKDYAMLTMEQEVTEDKYALAQFEHGLRMAEKAFEASLRAAEKKKEKEEKDAEDALMREAYSVDGIDVTGGQQATSKEFDMMSRLDAIAQEQRAGLDAATKTRDSKIADFLNSIINDPSKSNEQRELARTQLKSLGGQGAKGLFEQIKMVMEDAKQKARSGQAITDVDKINYKDQILASTSEVAVRNLIATNGQGLWAEGTNAKFVGELAQLQGTIETGRMLIEAQSEATKANAAAVRAQMVAENIEDADLFFNEDGTQKSLGSFKKDYYNRHSTKKALFETGWNPALAVTGAGFDIFMEDAEDAYQNLQEKYKETFNSGKVSLRTPYGTLGGDGEQGLAVMNKTWVMDPADVQIITAEDGTKMRVGTREKIRSLYQADLLGALSDASVGNNKVLFGNVGSLTADDIEEDDNSVARKVIAQTLMDAFTTQYKGSDADRPVLQVTRANIIAGDPDKVGVTFKISDPYLKANAGSDAVSGFARSLLGAAGASTNEITIVMDRNSVKSDFFKEVDGTPVEGVFNYRGSLNIDSYSKYAGTVKMTKGSDGSIIVSSGLKSYDPVSKAFIPLQGANGELSALDDVYPPDTDINMLYTKLNLVAQALSEENYRRIRSTSY